MRRRRNKGVGIEVSVLILACGIGLLVFSRLLWMLFDCPCRRINNRDLRWKSSWGSIARGRSWSELNHLPLVEVSGPLFISYKRLLVVLDNF